MTCYRKAGLSNVPKNMTRLTKENLIKLKNHISVTVVFVFIQIIS